MTHFGSDGDATYDNVRSHALETDRWLEQGSDNEFTDFALAVEEETDWSELLASPCMPVRAADIPGVLDPAVAVELRERIRRRAA